jgi:hypothetical protein
MANHPLQTLGFKPINRSLSELGFTLQSADMGTKDTESGRKIVQPTNDPTVDQALATQAMQDFSTRVRLAIGHIPGARLARVRDAKSPRRLAEKISLQEQPVETVTDYGAAQISVSSPQAKQAVVAAIRNKFTVLNEQDRFSTGDPQFHYRSDSLQVATPNGSSEELQIVPEEVLRANRQEHRDYVKARTAALDNVNDQSATVAARALDDGAMARFNLRNGPATRNRLQKGWRVELADGAFARVEYVDPNMRFVRVRTESGRNLTVRCKDLRGNSQSK